MDVRQKLWERPIEKKEIPFRGEGFLKKEDVVKTSFSGTQEIWELENFLFFRK